MLTSTPRQTGAVTAGHAATARVGAEALEQGGNAVDAVVAMGFASTVVESTLTSLAGGGFMLVGGGGVEPVMLDYFIRQPGIGLRRRVSPWSTYQMNLDSKALRFGVGPASVGVPGMVKGLAHAARRFGSLSLTELAAPAAELATSGVEVTRSQSDEHLLCLGFLTRTDEGRAIFAADTERGCRVAGDIMRQPSLARSIEQVGATNGETFYEGEIAELFARWSEQRGGRVTDADLRSFAVREVAPLVVRIGDVTVLTNPAPAMGGRIIARIVSALVDGAADDAFAARTIVEVLRELRPPLTVPPLEGEEVDVSELPTELHEAVSRMGPGDDDEVYDQHGGFARSPNTTHHAAVDRNGMFAAATTTVGFGSGEFVPGTGIQLNNVLAEYDHTRRRAPGAPVQSMMSPTILRGASTTVAIGSAGSDRIPQAISQILRRMWQGASLSEAIDAPRFVFDGEHLHSEPGFSDATLAAVETLVPITRWSDIDAYFGTSNGVALRDGTLFAHGDVRREGAGIVLD